MRPMTTDDLPMVAEWVARPHWQEWWGDPDDAIARIRDMLEGRDTTKPFIFEVDGRPTGYIQYWTVADNLHEPEAPWMLKLPSDAIGVDLAIADAALLSRGIGSTVVNKLARQLRDQGHREIIIDPNPANARAIRAYEKAGFRTIAALAGLYDDVHLMQYAPEKMP